MNDFAELMIGLTVCVMPPVVVIGGLVALFRYLRNDRNDERINLLEVQVAELRGQNLELLMRVQWLERRAAAAPTATPMAEAPAAPEIERATTPDGDGAPVEPPAAEAEAPVPPIEAPLVPPIEAAPTEAARNATVAGASAPELVAREIAPAAPEPDPAAINAAAAPSAPDAVPPPESQAAAAAAAAPPAPTPVEPPADKPRIAWEQWIGVRGAAALGASILVLAGIYFFEYSIEHGLITPAMRMVAGTLVGLACLGASELRLRRTHPVLASWIAGAGIAILYLAFWAGTALYSLYPSWAGGILMVATTAACVALALKRESIPVALLGLCGGFITPLALSTGQDRPIPLFAYLLLLDAAMLWVAYRRRWAWLASLSLLATVLYQQGWLLARLDEPRLILGVVIAVAFALLFGALPRLAPRPGEGEGAVGEGAEDESLLWRLTRSAGVVVPLLFTIPLAIRTDLGETFAVTAVQLLLLCAAACFVGLRHRAPVLPTAAALSSAVALFGRGLSHPPETALATWQPIGIALGLLAVFGIFAEIARRLDPTRRDLAAASAAFALTVLAFAALGAPLVEAAGPWPWLALWAASGLAAYRASTLMRVVPLQLGAAALIALGLGLALAALAGKDGQPDPGVHLGCLVAAAVLAQLAGLLPFRTDEARRWGDHAAALLAVIALPFVSFVDELDAIPVWAFYAATLALAVLALLAAARRGSAAWLAVAAAVTAGAHLLYVGRRHEGPFSLAELAVLGVTVLLFALFPSLSPKALRDQPWAWRTAALVGPANFFALRHVYLDVLGPSTIGALAVALAVVSVGAAYAVRVRGPEAAEARKVALVWLTASAAGFVTLAIPLQLENEWLSIGWALEALALAALWRRLDHAGLKYIVLGLGVAVCVRLIANPYVLGYYERADLRILNWLTYTYLVPAACFVGVWLLLRKVEGQRLRSLEREILPEGASPVAALAAAAAIAVVFAWINLTIFDWFATGEELAIPTDRLPARDLTISIAWALYAIGLLALGMWRQSTALRVTSLLLILLTLAKVFLYDLAQLADLYRVASLAGLAISLIVISLAYQRFVFRSARKEEVKP